VKTVTLHDTHCHFLSPRFYDVIGREARGHSGATGESPTADLGWEVPCTPEELADRWAGELDRHRISRAALIASVPGDEESVATAIVKHSRRFVGFFALNAAAPDAVGRARRAFGELHLRCACLFPAMHGYRLDDERVKAVFACAAEHHAAMFVHCGFLTIEARTKLGLRSAFDLRLGDPLALATTAALFPSVPVIVPHFGAGFFREALMAADLCPNIHFDTSSSNSWVRFVPELTLAEVFRHALAVVGPDRLIFGTDSSFFPRGWRRVIHGAQQAILDELGVEEQVSQKIFAGNFDRVFPQ
jgi:predicted TIM-barrel fold metal-dependent hydrolase